MSESLLRTHVCDLRHVLEDDVIETVPGRGYRLLADVGRERRSRHTEMDSLGSPFLELVRGCESPSPCLAAEVASAVRASGSASMARGALRGPDDAGIKAVLLLVGDERCEGVAALFGAASAKEPCVAVRLPRGTSAKV